MIDRVPIEPHVGPATQGADRSPSVDEGWGGKHHVAGNNHDADLTRRSAKNMSCANHRDLRQADVNMRSHQVLSNEFGEQYAGSCFSVDAR